MFKSEIPIAEINAKYADESSLFLEMDNLNIHYKIEGEGEPIILLHSTNTTLHDWEEWTAILKTSFKVIRLDLPGFGLTGAPKNHNFKFDLYIYFLKKFALNIGLSKFHIAGIEFGGNLAWEFALLHPHIINKLVIINALGHPNTEQELFCKTNGTSASKRQIKKHFLKMFSKEAFVTTERIQRRKDIMMRTGNKTALKRFLDMDHKSRYKRMNEIESPTLIQWTKTMSNKSPYETIAKSKVKFYEKCGLLPIIEASEATAKDVFDFLK